MFLLRKKGLAYLATVLVLALLGGSLLANCTLTVEAVQWSQTSSAGDGSLLLVQVRNRCPGSIRLQEVAFPLDATARPSAFGTPGILEPDGTTAALHGHPVGFGEVVRIGLPLSLAPGEAVDRLQLRYQHLGMQKETVFSVPSPTPAEGP